MKYLVLCFIFCFFHVFCYTQNKIPKEPGEQGTFYNETTKNKYIFTIKQNNPYALPSKGLDFKFNEFISKYTVGSIGLNYFIRPDKFREHQFKISFVIGILNDTLHQSTSTIVSNNSIIYSFEYRGFRFMSETIKENVDYVREDYHDFGKYKMPDKRKDNTLLVKRLIQYGISYGAQNLFGNYKTVTNQIINTSNNTQSTNSNEIKKYVFPFESLVLSIGLERRRNEFWEYHVSNFSESNFTLTGSFTRFLFSPLLVNQFIGPDLMVHNKFTTLKSHLGFSLGAYCDYGGAYQGTIETGIMPGLGFYIKIGLPLFECSLYRSKKNVDGSLNRIKYFILKK